MRSIKAFLPLLLFVALFLGSGIYYHFQGVEFAFYQIPAPIAALPAIVLAVILSRGKLDERIENFIRGMGDINVLTMCVIYLLAGAFSVLTKHIGAVDVAVQVGLNIFPAKLILPGLFFLSALLSLSMGTSMGTISAIGPIAFGIAERTELPMGTLFGALVGGAMFGDNLSIISDTTIAATKTQGAKMVDKFKENFKFALPAAIITMILLSRFETNFTEIPYVEVEWVKIIPYALLLILALSGMNVFVVLFAGILSTAILAFSVVPDYSLKILAQNIFTGFKEMQEIFLLSLMIGGLGKMMKDAGGIKIIQKSFGKIHGFFTELGLAFAVMIANLAVANNTVAILICGDFFKEISEKEKISPKRSASILDTFSCIIQGIIPYGAQILLASQLSKVSPLELMTEVTYCYLLGFITIAYMLISSFKKKFQ